MRSRRASAKLLAASLVAAAVVLAVPDQMRSVATPMVVGLLIAVGFFAVLSARSKIVPIAEIGTTFVAAVVVYLVVPLLMYLVLGGTYTVVNDNRLLQLQPSPTEVGRAGWLYVAFLASFATVYVMTRGRAEPPRTGVGLLSRNRLAIMVALYLVFSLLSFMLVPRLTSESYAGGYAAVAALPLATRQFMKLWQGWSVLLTLGVRVWLFQDFKRRKWIIAAWILYDLLTAATGLGSRTGLAISVVSSVFLYHLLVRPIRLRTALAGALVCLVGFLAFGIARAYTGGGGFAAVGQWNLGGVGGEFESLFGNVIDLQHRLASGEVGPLPPAFHFADIVAPFPSQILPFQKYDPAAWYVGTFFPLQAESGAGLAFGAIAQGVLGFGWIELLIRGCVLGYAFARFHRYFSRRADRFWVAVMYVWLTVWCYQSFRDQSFILLTYILQWFVPLVLVVEGGVRILRGSSARDPASAFSAVAQEGSQGSG